MKKISFNLTDRTRLELSLVKSRGLKPEDDPLLPTFKEIRRTRSGNKISRFFRHIFEHQKIKKVLGSALALVVLSTPLLPGTTIAQNFEPEQAVISVAESPVNTQSGTQYPVEEVIITQGYHFFHPAIDLDGITGDPIRPIMTGQVEAVQYSRFGLGNTVYLNHGNGIVSVYAHLSKIEVEVGQEVDQSTQLGEMGASGRSFGDHLHLEVHIHGQPINPLSILPTIPDRP